MSRSHLLLVTGKLAQPALSRVIAEIAKPDLECTVATLPITVAALATTPWIARHLQVPAGVSRIILPGLCYGELSDVEKATGLPVERGPDDLLDLPAYLSGEPRAVVPLQSHDISILAEINHVQRLTTAQILALASCYRASGADMIDLGCDADVPWTEAQSVVASLRREGFRLSIDSFNSADVEAAVAAGAELVLSVNGTNRRRARGWGCEVVAIPDTPGDLDSLERTVNDLAASGVCFRIDPILEPIGFGLAASLGRFVEVRKRYPEAELFMGVGNVTELTDVDSAGINVLLLGFCQELGIRSVLTTEVINWCRTSVAELDLGRRLVYHACRERVLPKNLTTNLLMLRDPKIRERGPPALRELAARLTDRHYRLFAEGNRIHALNGATHLYGTDPFALFAEMNGQKPIDSAHAFYLGYEMCKAVTAITLGKNYVQDQALRWGFLTRSEQTANGTIAVDEGDVSNH